MRIERLGKHLSHSIGVRHCDSTQRWKFYLDIEFTNVSLCSISYAFDNRSRNAEFCNLRILDQERKRVVPTRGFLVRPRGQIPPTQLSSGETFKYTLEGDLSPDGALWFPGASYKLQLGASYEISFNYFGRDSNVVKWKAPEVSQ